MVFAVKDSPVYLEGAFDLAAAMVEGQAEVEGTFRTGRGVAWGEGFPRTADKIDRAGYRVAPPQPRKAEGFPRRSAPSQTTTNDADVLDLKEL